MSTTQFAIEHKNRNQTRTISPEKVNALCYNYDIYQSIGVNEEIECVLNIYKLTFDFERNNQLEKKNFAICPICIKMC